LYGVYAHHKEINCAYAKILVPFAELNNGRINQFVLAIHDLYLYTVFGAVKHIKIKLQKIVKRLGPYSAKRGRGGFIIKGGGCINQEHFSTVVF
jgi:hypothetical protein